MVMPGGWVFLMSEEPLYLESYTTQNTTYHTVEHDPFIKRQITSLNYLWGLMWCKFGHVTIEISTPKNPRTPPCGINHKVDFEGFGGSNFRTLRDQICTS